jgi:hypothetical protein
LKLEKIADFAPHHIPQWCIRQYNPCGEKNKNKNKK